MSNYKKKRSAARRQRHSSSKQCRHTQGRISIQVRPADHQAAQRNLDRAEESFLANHQALVDEPTLLDEHARGDDDTAL